MAIDFDWLESRVFGRRLDDDERRAMGEALEARRIERGQTLIAQGAPGGDLFLLREGGAEVCIERGGRQVRIASGREGALFGEMTFLTGGSASATVVVTEPAVVYRLGREAALRLMREHPELMLGLFAYMLAHHADTVRRMNEDFFRIYDYLTSSHK